MNVAYGAIHTLVHLPGLVLTLTTFNGKYQYSQTGGLAMGSRLVPACSRVTSRNKSLITTQDEHPICKAVYNVYRWHCRREEIEDFTTCTFVNGFYPSLKFNWSISDEQVPFPDLVLIPTTLDCLLYTSIHYKPTDTHILFMCHSL